MCKCDVYHLVKSRTLRCNKLKFQTKFYIKSRVTFFALLAPSTPSLALVFDAFQQISLAACRFGHIFLMLKRLIPVILVLAKFLNVWDKSVKSHPVRLQKSSRQIVFRQVLNGLIPPPQLHVSRLTSADSGLPPVNRLCSHNHRLTFTHVWGHMARPPRHTRNYAGTITMSDLNFR